MPGTFGIPNYNHITMPVFNDAWMDSHRVLIEASPSQQEEMMNPEPSPNMKQLPSIEEMTKHVLYQENPLTAGEVTDDSSGDESGAEKQQRPKKHGGAEEEKKERNSAVSLMDSYAWYEYDDYHPSNANRFYVLNGVASSINGRGPVGLGEVAAAGLCQLQAKSRRQAEDEMMQSPLFEQFVNAVKNKGFFDDPQNSTPKDDPKEEEDRLILQKAVYDERMAKVACKFRNKLAAKVDLQDERGTMMQMIDYHHGRRCKRVVQSRKLKSMGIGLLKSMADLPLQFKETSMHLRKTVPMSPDGATAAARQFHQDVATTPKASTTKALEPEVLEKEAEKLKSQGNAHMQKKEYEAALGCYTQALRLTPSGPQSHVYFSNRAAALLSMKKFDQAILDSERALALQPTYGKAHARLGLAHFLLGDYRHAMEAYTVALKYEPDNKSSKSYLEKAAKKLAAAQPGHDGENGVQPIGTSFSLVSEWDKERGRKDGKASRRNSGSSVASSGSSVPGTSSANAPISTNKGNRLPGKPGMMNDVAEKHKSQGNAHMANREYDLALEAYTAAIDLSPNGPQSHVYYSNRAAALCYLEQYLEAAQDSEQALQLKPTYGKAHARLGLARFFLQDYEGAVEAYTAALKYDPDNAASKSYLAKAKAKLEKQRHEESIQVTADARRLMEDPDMIRMAKKVMNNKGVSGQEMLLDPEMQQISRKAMADPAMLGVIQSLSYVDRGSLDSATSR
jgi:tetratricopeptide (TPR) repeat protein